MGQRLLAYTLDQRGEHVCLTLTGELDLPVVNQLEAALHEALALHPQTLTVDVGGVDLIDSVSTSLLIRSYEAARADGRRFTVVDSRGLVLRVLQIMGLDFLTQPPAGSASTDR